jgi:dolichyl-phosphate-mannose--protein O-mannosyl transferase
MIRALGNRTVAIWAVVAGALFLRLFRLSTPNELIFDEVYYVDGARDFLKFGVEVSANKPEFIVHPPVGKWVIASGIKVFGDNPFGWRVAVALLGTLSILLIAKIASRIFGALGYGLIAALLALFDGLNLVMSRTALLDITLTTFLLVATWFLIERRYLLAGLFSGLALGTKWSAIFYIITFSLFFIVKEIRESAASEIFPQRTRRQILVLIALRKIQLILVPLFVYLLSWVGWFSSNRGWSRFWAEDTGSFFLAPIKSFIHYQFEILHFHQGLDSKHNYRSSVWQWLLQIRPTSFYYESPQCGVAKCSQEVLALGTPLLWWSGALSLLLVIALWFRRRENSLILLGVGAGLLPWFAFPDRTTFSFYSIVFEPWIILAIVAVIKEINEQLPARISRISRKLTLGAFIGVIGLNFIYHLPIFVAIIVSYDYWRSLMWFDSWI